MVGEVLDFIDPPVGQQSVVSVTQWWSAQEVWFVGTEDLSHDPVMTAKWPMFITFLLVEDCAPKFMNTPYTHKHTHPAGSGQREEGFGLVKLTSSTFQGQTILMQAKRNQPPGACLLMQKNS